MSVGNGSIAWAKNIWDHYARKDAMWAVLATHDEDRFWKTGEDEIEGLLKAGLISSSSRVGDLGCGIGRLSLALAKRVRSVVSMDVSAEMLARLKEKAANVSNLTTFQIEDGRYPPGPFDAIVSFLVLQHMPTQVARSTLSALANSLAPNGRMLIDLPIREWEPQMPYGWNEISANQLWESRCYRLEEADQLLFAPAGLVREKDVVGVRPDRRVLVLKRSEASAEQLAEAKLLASALELRAVNRHYFWEHPDMRPAFLEKLNTLESLYWKRVRPRAQRVLRVMHDFAFPREAEYRRLLDELVGALATRSGRSH